MVLLGCCCSCSSSIDYSLIVYHAMLLLCHSDHPAHAFVWIDEHNIVHAVFQIHLWRPVPFLFCVSFFFISSDLAHRAPITSSVAVRLFAPDRDSCVLASSCGPPLVLLQWSISQFSLGIRTSIVAAYFFILVFISFPACFSSTRANFGLYEANKLYFCPSAGGSKTIPG